MAPEELANIIRDPPRDTELIELFKAFSGPAPLPARLEESESQAKSLRPSSSGAVSWFHCDVSGILETWNFPIRAMGRQIIPLMVIPRRARY
jgi:hypothetical protein